MSRKGLHAMFLMQCIKGNIFVCIVLSLYDQLILSVAAGVNIAVSGFQTSENKHAQDVSKIYSAYKIEVIELTTCPDMTFGTF